MRSLPTMFRLWRRIRVAEFQTRQTCRRLSPYIGLLRVSTYLAACRKRRVDEAISFRSTLQLCSRQQTGVTGKLFGCRCRTTFTPQKNQLRAGNNWAEIPQTVEDMSVVKLISKTVFLAARPVLIGSVNHGSSWQFSHTRRNRQCHQILGQATQGRGCVTVPRNNYESQGPDTQGRCKIRGWSSRVVIGKAHKADLWLPNFAGVDVKLFRSLASMSQACMEGKRIRGNTLWANASVITNAEFSSFHYKSERSDAQYLSTRMILREIS